MHVKNNFFNRYVKSLASGTIRPRLTLRVALISALVFGFANVSQAKVFFEDNFENGSVNASPSPKWSWKAPISAGNISSGMMYSDNNSDIYSVSSKVANAGKHSLRLDFNGRNNWCNMCGSKTVKLTQSDVNSGCVSVTGAPWHNVLYNKTNGFSTWQITNSSSNKVCFKDGKAVNNSLTTNNRLAAGDEIKIPYQCGINGIVGRNKDRRSDCDKAINYLNGQTASDLGYGQTLSRRFYMYIPKETVLPGVTLKLGYSHFRRGGSLVNYTLKLSTQRNSTISLTAPGGKYNTNSSGYAVQKGVWHYFEEVFKRESSASANDGSYKLYTGAVTKGDKLKTPHVSQNNLKLGSFVDMSFMGNFQHFNDAKGYIYFDDILISDSYVGPNGSKAGNGSPAATPEEPSPPAPPKLSQR